MKDPFRDPIVYANEEEVAELDEFDAKQAKKLNKKKKETRHS